VNTDLCTHDSTPFNKKVNESKREEFIQKVTETRKLFNSKWQKWEQEMVKTGVKK
jgi:ClpP class serine protease